MTDLLATTRQNVDHVVPSVNLHPLVKTAYDVVKLCPTTDQKCERRPHPVVTPRFPRSRLPLSQSVSAQSCGRSPSAAFRISI